MNDKKLEKFFVGKNDMMMDFLEKFESEFPEYDFKTMYEGIDGVVTAVEGVEEMSNNDIAWAAMTIVQATAMTILVEHGVIKEDFIDSEFGEIIDFAEIDKMISEDLLEDTEE